MHLFSVKNKIDFENNSKSINSDQLYECSFIINNKIIFFNKKIVFSNLKN